MDLMFLNGSSYLSLFVAPERVSSLVILPHDVGPKSSKLDLFFWFPLFLVGEMNINEDV